MVSRSSRQPLSATLVEYVPRDNAFSVSDYARRVQGDYFWSMPVQFLENKVRHFRSDPAFTSFTDHQDHSWVCFFHASLRK